MYIRLIIDGSLLPQTHQHFRLLLHRAHIILIFVVPHIYRLGHIPEHQIAVAVVCLEPSSISVFVVPFRCLCVLKVDGWMDGQSHVQSPGELAIAAQLHKYGLVEG